MDTLIITIHVHFMGDNDDQSSYITHRCPNKAELFVYIAS